LNVRPVKIQRWKRLAGFGNIVARKNAQIVVEANEVCRGRLIEANGDRESEEMSRAVRTGRNLTGKAS